MTDNRVIDEPEAIRMIQAARGWTISTMDALTWLIDQIEAGIVRQHDSPHMRRPIDLASLKRALGKKDTGRPPKFNWDLFWIEVAARANTPDGLPDKQAELIDAMSQWCEDMFGEQPAPSTLKEKISPLYARLDRAGN